MEVYESQNRDNNYNCVVCVRVRIVNQPTRAYVEHQRLQSPVVRLLLTLAPLPSYMCTSHLQNFVVRLFVSAPVTMVIADPTRLKQPFGEVRNVWKILKGLKQRTQNSNLCSLGKRGFSNGFSWNNSEKYNHYLYIELKLVAMSSFYFSRIFQACILLSRKWLSCNHTRSEDKQK